MGLKIPLLQPLSIILTPGKIISFSNRGVRLAGWGITTTDIVSSLTKLVILFLEIKKIEVRVPSRTVFGRFDYLREFYTKPTGKVTDTSRRSTKNRDNFLFNVDDPEGRRIDCRIIFF